MADNRSRSSNDKQRRSTSGGKPRGGKPRGGKSRPGKSQAGESQPGASKSGRSDGSGSPGRKSQGARAGGASRGDRSQGARPTGGSSKGGRSRRDADERKPQERRRSDGSRGSSGRGDRGRKPSPAPRPEPSPPEPQYEWVDEGPVGGTRDASSNGGKPRSRRNQNRGGGAPVVRVPSFTAAVGQQRGKRLEGRFEDAARAFAAERFTEARSILKPIEAEAPAVPEVQELYGLTLYRLGRWKDAAAHLREFVGLTGGSVEQHPVLADCERALGHHDTVDRLWVELREVSPSAELVTEGRIVTAGSLADRGELSAAIALLSKGFRFPRKPREHHLRRAYVLADLYERSGDLPQARQLFDRVAQVSPGFVDVEDRIAALG